MTRETHMLTIAEGTKIDSDTLRRLTNNAWNKCREECDAMRESGKSDEEILNLLGQAAASYKACYEAYSQELAVRGISLRNKQKEANNASDRERKRLQREQSDSEAPTREKINASRTPTAQNLKTRPVTGAGSSHYTPAEKQVIKLLTPLAGGDLNNLPSIEEMANAICMAKGVKYTALLEKIQKHGAPK